jgi:hypothetical protein
MRRTATARGSFHETTDHLSANGNVEIFLTTSILFGLEVARSEVMV